MADIFVPQNTIDSARPADLSGDGVTGNIADSGLRALALRRQLEDLKSNEAYTKAIKDNTNPNTGVLNMAGVYTELKNNKDYTLNADHYTPTSEEISARNAQLAKMFNDSDRRLDAMVKTGAISQSVAKGGKALNQNARKLYGISNIQAPYGAESYVSTGLATSAKPDVFDSGDTLIIGRTPAIASSKTPVSFNQSISKGVTPGERIQATLPKPYTISTSEGQQTVLVQPTVTRHGQTKVNIGGAIGSDSATTDALTKQVAQEYADSIPNLRKAQQQENNYSEAADSILNGQGKANWSVLSKVFGGSGLPVGSTGQREEIAKNVASTLASNGVSTPTDFSLSLSQQASGINSQNLGVMQLANFLNRSRNMQDVILNNFLANNRTNPKKIEYATQMAAKYGKDASDLAMLHLLAQQGVNNPTLVKKNIDLMRRYMPTKVEELWNKRDLYHQAVKDGAIVHGYPNSPIFIEKVKHG